jgi:hypothetical protein
MVMNPIIREIIEKGIRVIIEYNKETKKDEYVLHGFYKSGTATLFEDLDGRLMARARYNEITPINTFNDIVYLNYEWWTNSRHRNECWEEPDKEWLPFLIEAKLIKVETKTRYVPKNE